MYVGAWGQELAVDGGPGVEYFCSPSYVPPPAAKATLIQVVLIGMEFTVMCSIASVSQLSISRKCPPYQKCIILDTKVEQRKQNGILTLVGGRAAID